MTISDAKVRAMANSAIKSLESEPGITLTSREKVFSVLVEELEAVLNMHEEMVALAKRRIEKLSRRVAPGSREWDGLIAQYMDEERRKRGIF